MSTTKKAKKQKGKTISLQEFAASLEPATTAGQNVIYAPKAAENIRSWADEVEEDDYVTKDKVRIVLPSAPRASRGPDFDESQIPNVPPFVAHIGNISYDIDDEDILDFFKTLDIKELRLPRDANNRLRGFGYVQFQTRDHLIEALCMNEQMLRGRPLRISPGQGSDGDRRGGGGRGHIDETPDDWRATEKLEFGPPRGDMDRTDFRGRSDFGGGRSDYGQQGSEFGRRPFGSRNEFDRGGDFGGRRGGDFDRDQSRSNFGQREDFDRSDFGSRRGGGFGRNYRDDQTGGEAEEEGTWRRNPGEKYEPPQEDRRYGNRERDPQEQDRRYGGRDRELHDYDRRYGSRESDLHDQDRRYGGRDREASPDFSDARTRQPRTQSPEFERPKYVAPPQSRQDDEVEQEREPRKPSPPRERKKLVMAPRTITESSNSVVPTSSIFGGARPVDTASREREIEKKLAEQNEEPKRVRLFLRSKTEIKRAEVEEPSPNSASPPPVTNERVPLTPLVIPESTQNSKESSKSSDDNESTPPKKSEPQPPPPIINAWNERRERQESRVSNREPSQSEVPKSGSESEDHHHYDDEERPDPSLTRESDRDDQHSPPPDSDHKDTNSEPEDERDLRLQKELDDFQRVERRGRKPKPPPPVEVIQRSEYNRGSGVNYGRGGRGGRRGNN